MSSIPLVSIRSGDPSPSADEVRGYLRALLAQSAFNASERNRRFLSYVVEETLAGRADRIKAYSIALTVFNRSQDFDPLIDPIMRIEASRLRRSLEHYYLTAGKADRIRIDIPKGSYVATFGYSDPTSADDAATKAATSTRPAFAARRRWNWRIGGAAVAVLFLLAAALIVDRTGERFRADGGAAHPNGPSVMVMPFENIGGDPGRDFIARDLTYKIIGALTEFGELFVFAPEASFGIGRPSAQPADSIHPDYVLSGSVHSTGNAVRISALLSDSRTGQYVWSTDLERDLSTVGLRALESDIAGQVAGAIAEGWPRPGIIDSRPGPALKPTRRTKTERERRAGLSGANKSAIISAP